jgi:hypothetical protein
MEDSLKSHDKEGKSSPYLILEMSTGLSMAAVPVHASLTEEHLVGLVIKEAWLWEYLSI